MNNITMDGYTRVSKNAARRLYANGGTVYVQSCKFIPKNSWQSAMSINNDFDAFVRSFEFYNCDYERGYYAAFYVKEGTKAEYSKASAMPPGCDSRPRYLAEGAGGGYTFQYNNERFNLWPANLTAFHELKAYVNYCNSCDSESLNAHGLQMWRTQGKPTGPI